MKDWPGTFDLAVVGCGKALVNACNNTAADLGIKIVCEAQVTHGHRDGDVAPNIYPA